MKFRRVIKISRPRFWIYELGTFMFGIFTTIGSFGQLSDWRIWVLSFYFLLPANILIYGINDIYDYETDKLNPKKVQYEALVAPDQQKKLWKWILVTNLPFIVVVPFLPITSAIALAGFVFFATFYSAKPIRAKAKPVLDSFFSAAHYTVTALVGFALVASQGIMPWQGLLAGLLWAMSMHAYSAVPDIKADTDAKLSTVATKLGPVPTIVLCLLGYTAAALLAAPLLGWFIWLAWVPYLILMLWSIKTIQHKKDIFFIYTYFPWVNMCVGMVLTLILLVRLAI